MIARLYRRICLRLHGLPIATIVYKPWRKGKNVDIFALTFAKDDYLMARYDEIAEHIRTCYQADMDKMYKESDK